MRVTIIDDHVFVRQGIEALLAQAFPTATVSSLESIPSSEAVFAMEADLIVCDYRVGSENALSLLRSVASHPSAPPVLVISMLEESEVAPACIAAGASGFVSKASPSDQFIAAVKMLLDGRTYFSATTTKAAFLRNLPATNNVPTSISGILSHRELEVFSIIGEGLSVGLIAQRLGISVKTVESHRENIKNKLNLHTASEVVIAASQWLSSGS